MSNKDARRIVVPARLSYTYVAEPRPDDEKTNSDGDPLYYYGTQLLIPMKDKATVTKMQNAVKAAIVQKFGPDKAKALWKNPNFKKPWRDADEEGRDGAEYKGMFFANCKTNAKSKTDYASRPGVALKNRTKLTDITEIHEHIYSGCHAYVSITAYYFKSKGAQGIALALNNILKDKDGERLDGSVDVMDEFDDMFDDDEFNDSSSGGVDDGFGDDEEDDFGF